MAENKAAPTGAHTEQPGGHQGGFPPFQRDTFASQLVWLAITFVAIYLLIARIAIPRIGGILEDRAKRIEGDHAAAQKLREESEAALAAYEKALADARGRAQGIGAEIRDKLNAEAEGTRKSLEAKLAAQLADAEKSIAATKSAAMANVRGIAVEATAAIVERLIGTAPASAAVSVAVDDALKR